MAQGSFGPDPAATPSHPGRLWIVSALFCDGEMMPCMVFMLGNVEICRNGFSNNYLNLINRPRFFFGTIQK